MLYCTRLVFFQKHSQWLETDDLFTLMKTLAPPPTAWWVKLTGRVLALALPEKGQFRSYEMNLVTCGLSLSLLLHHPLGRISIRSEAALSLFLPCVSNPDLLSLVQWNLVSQNNFTIIRKNVLYFQSSCFMVGMVQWFVLSFRSKKVSGLVPGCWG